ncbi:MAG TPA: carbohydrate kinase family protein [Bryobacteraceae bacterium]|nr:carbohydrate kinase family protein [Bryobacteraceae bacterium]
MIACIGGAHIDRHGVLRGPLVLGSSNPGSVLVAAGGVARNVAENLARLGERVMLVSRVGDDAAGVQVRESAAACGIDTSLVTVSCVQPTASYTAILENNGELVLGLADMDIYEELSPAALEPFLMQLRDCSYWFVDANLPGTTIDWLLSSAGEIPVAVDAISVAKAPRLTPMLGRVSLLFANMAQTRAMSGRAEAPVPEALQELGARAGVVTAGPAGIVVWQGQTVDRLPALPARVRDVTGAGDALVAGTLFGIAKGESLLDACRLGLAAAAITIESPQAAAPELTADLVRSRSREGVQ